MFRCTVLLAHAGNELGKLLLRLNTNYYKGRPTDSCYVNAWCSLYCVACDFV